MGSWLSPFLSPLGSGWLQPPESVERTPIGTMGPQAISGERARSGTCAHLASRWCSGTSLGDLFLTPRNGYPGLEKCIFFSTPCQIPDRLKMTHFRPFPGIPRGPSFCLVLSLSVIPVDHGFLAILHSPGSAPGLNQPSSHPPDRPGNDPFWVPLGVNTPP